MQIRGRHLWTLGGVVSFVAVGVTAYFPAPTLGEAIVRQAEARLGITLELASASFSLTRGIRLEGVTAEASSRTLVLSAEIDSLVAAHELSLRRPLRINTIRLVHPTLTAIVGERPDRPREPLDSTPSPPEHERDSSPEGPDGADIRGLQFDDLGIDLERAVIEVRGPGAGTYPLRATGMDIVLRDVIHDGSAASLVHALVGTGTLRARKLWIGPVLVVDASSGLSLGGGHFLLSDLTFWCGGRHFFLSEVDIDFTSDPFSFGTRSSILERLKSDPNAPEEWVLIASLMELDGVCDE